MTPTHAGFFPVNRMTGEPFQLAMQRLWLTGQILPAGARLVVQHVFRSSEERPVEMIYCFPLPRDAAMRSFRITGPGFDVTSELKPAGEAEAAYEEGILGGSLSVLAREYDDGLVNLTAGNIRPGETVTVHLEILAGVAPREDGFRFRFPFALAPCYHPQLRVASLPGGWELELPGDRFGDLILPRFAAEASELHEVGFELTVAPAASLVEIGSPSHAITVRNRAGSPARVALAPANDVPDRDLVLDARFEENRLLLLSGPSGEGKRSFAAVIPPAWFGEETAGPRRVAILLDSSGSMDGEPMAQAKKAIEACLAALSEEDLFNLVAFDNTVEAMHTAVVPATRENRDKANTFLRAVVAGGGTGLGRGVKEAAQTLGGAGDILILTDGQVFETETILAAARATGTRLFCLGIGEASQDRFLALLARQTGGLCRFVTPKERVDMEALELFASMGRTVASGLKADAGVQPEPPPVVFSRAPVVLFGEVDAKEGAAVGLTWTGGAQKLEIPAGDAETGETVRLLRGARLITDAQSRYSAATPEGAMEKRQQERAKAWLAQLSRTYGLASREMSLVAVVKRGGDRPGELPDTRVVAIGARPVAAKSTPMYSRRLPVDRPTMAMYQSRMEAEPDEVLRSRKTGRPSFTLVDLAAMLEPDGGMPGGSEEERIARSAAAVLAFAAGGHSVRKGAFRMHVARLAAFLERQKAGGDAWPLLERALAAAAAGKAPERAWIELARDPATRREQVEEALAAESASWANIFSKLGKIVR